MSWSQLPKELQELICDTYVSKVDRLTTSLPIDTDQNYYHKVIRRFWLDLFLKKANTYIYNMRCMSSFDLDTCYISKFSVDFHNILSNMNREEGYFCEIMVGLKNRSLHTYQIRISLDYIQFHYSYTFDIEDIDVYRRISHIKFFFNYRVHKDTSCLDISVEHFQNIYFWLHDDSWVHSVVAIRQFLETGDFRVITQIKHIVSIKQKSSFCLRDILIRD